MIAGQADVSTRIQASHHFVSIWGALASKKNLIISDLHIYMSTTLVENDDG